MKNSDEAMEKVLAGLRGVEAPHGMERRILSALDAVEDETSVGARSSWNWLRPMWLVAPLRPVVTRPVVCGIALAGLVVIGFLIPAFRGIGRVPVQSSPAKAKIELPSAGPEPSAGSAEAVAEIAPARAGVEAVRKTDVRVAARARGGNGESVDDSDSLAVSEMRAASHPAPPMPLTEQERLLLRIVHKDDPVEMAVLNPAWRAARDAEDQAEFQSFFGDAADRAATDAPKVEQPTTEEQPTEQKPTTEQPKMEQ